MLSQVLDDRVRADDPLQSRKRMNRTPTKPHEHPPPSMVVLDGLISKRVLNTCEFVVSKFEGISKDPQITEEHYVFIARDLRDHYYYKDTTGLTDEENTNSIRVKFQALAVAVSENMLNHHVDMVLKTRLDFIKGRLTNQPIKRDHPLILQLAYQSIGQWKATRHTQMVEELRAHLPDTLVTWKQEWTAPFSPAYLAGGPSQGNHNRYITPARAAPIEPAKTERPAQRRRLALRIPEEASAHNGHVEQPPPPCALERSPSQLSFQSDSTIDFAVGSYDDSADISWSPWSPCSAAAAGGNHDSSIYPEFFGAHEDPIAYVHRCRGSQSQSSIGEGGHAANACLLNALDVLTRDKTTLEYFFNPDPHPIWDAQRQGIPEGLGMQGLTEPFILEIARITALECGCWP